MYENNTWVEQQRRDMRHLVYSICYSDITGEGVKDLVIASEGGIHILKVSYLLRIKCFLNSYN